MFVVVVVVVVFMGWRTTLSQSIWVSRVLNTFSNMLAVHSTYQHMPCLVAIDDCDMYTVFPTTPISAHTISC